MPINPIYVQPKVDLIRPKRPTTNNPEAFNGEKETLLKIYNEYLKPYKNTPKGILITTILDVDPSARAFILQLEKRLVDLGAIPERRSNGIKY